jgi:hypothetical protein
MKKLIATTALSICATLSAMETQKAFTQTPTKIMNLRKLGEPSGQTSTRESMLAKAPEGKRFVNLRPLTGKAKL